MKQLLIQLFFLLCCGAVSATGVYNVRDFGAKGDGQTLDSLHISVMNVLTIGLLCCLMT